MGHHFRRESCPFPSSSPRIEFHHQPRQPHHLDHFENDADIECPFGKLSGLSRDDVRETAYEIFFTSCRSSPGFGGRNALVLYWNHVNEGSKANAVVMSPTSRVKKALGLKMIRRSPSKRMTSGGAGGGLSTPTSPVAHNGSNGASPSIAFTLPNARPRRPMTSAEIMRQQMRVTEHSDNRLRKTLMRSLVGQMGRRAETIILPLEVLRHIKPSEFSDSNEYHMWQRRQLRVLEAGLLLHPSIHLEKTNTFAMRLREIIRVSETKPIDTGKNSDTMRTLCNSVVSLSWRSANGTPTDVCHWADGCPLNINLYTALLQAVFDVRDETLVLDEVDELLELMKKTWSILGITRAMHNLCFTWVIFHQYVATAQIEPDLLCAAHTMLTTEVENDAKKLDREAMYAKLLSSVLNSILGWTEKRLLHYHEYFQRGCVGQIENLLPVALSASKILGEDIIITEGTGEDGNITVVDTSGDRLEYYIRSSMKNAFAKIIENGDYKEAMSGAEEVASEALLQLAEETEELASNERECFSPVLQKWCPAAAAIATVTLQSCYGNVLKQYLGGVSSLTKETVRVLQRAAKLEKVLIQMVMEESSDGDGGSAIVKEMAPFEVDSIIRNLVRAWINETLEEGKDSSSRAKETEVSFSRNSSFGFSRGKLQSLGYVRDAVQLLLQNWNPKSKVEPHALSAVELMTFAKQTVQDFFEIPVGITEELVGDLANGLETLIIDYINFVAACGAKQNYIPPLPPLTRCNKDSKFVKLWKRVSHCSAVDEDTHLHGDNEGHHPRPSTSRGTQRLYVRLNTLHYLLTQIHVLDKSLSSAPGVIPSTPHNRFTGHRRLPSTYYFEQTTSSIMENCQHVSEVAAYRLVFHDASSVFYEGLYIGDVTNARIRPALRILKQNLTVLTTILTDKAQALAVKEIMKASFHAFFMVLLAGGTSRVFCKSDYHMIKEDLESLKKVFCTCGEGLISEDVVDREAEVLGGVVSLFGKPTEQLIVEFSMLTRQNSCVGFMHMGRPKLPMPTTTGRWHKLDPNTIMRVLCYRRERSANHFLKRAFQLTKRR